MGFYISEQVGALAADVGGVRKVGLEITYRRSVIVGKTKQIGRVQATADKVIYRCDVEKAEVIFAALCVGHGGDVVAVVKLV